MTPDGCLCRSLCSINYIKWPVAEWSKLSFSSPELLAHAAWLYSRFESSRWLYSVYTNKKLSHPSSLSCVLAVAPTLKRSAVQPKTTRLCSSIILISLCTHTTTTVPHKNITTGWSERVLCTRIRTLYEDSEYCTLGRLYCT